MNHSLVLTTYPDSHKLFKTWQKTLPKFLSAYPTPGPSFYGSVLHPHFNVDSEDVGLTSARFKRVVKRTNENVAQLQKAFVPLREAGVGEGGRYCVQPENYADAFTLDMATSLRGFSYRLLSLISTTPNHDSPQYVPEPSDEDSPPEEREDVHTWAPNNGAWCWRDDCQGTFFTSDDSAAVLMID